MQMNTHHSSALSCPSAPVNVRAHVRRKGLCCWGNVDHSQQGNALPGVIDQLLPLTDMISQSFSDMFVFREVILPYQRFLVIILHTCTKVNPEY